MAEYDIHNTRFIALYEYVYAIGKQVLFYELFPEFVSYFIIH
jgi:hypothetical protein